MWDKPGWRLYLLLPLLHFASAALTFHFAVTTEGVVFVWLPNAVLLAALLRFDGRRGWLMALLTFASDMAASLPQFSAGEAALLAAVNLVEVVAAYLLMRRLGVSARLESIQDLARFLLAGPLAGALFAGFLGAAVLQAYGRADATPYLSVVRLWWFSEGLGLMIYTPLLLALTYPPDEAARRHWLDVPVVLVAALLTYAVFFAPAGPTDALVLTPTLLLPLILYMGARFRVRATALVVALISFAAAWALSLHRSPFGNVAPSQQIAAGQEFILTLCIVGLGCAVLVRELRAAERDLEAKVRERTRELEASNAKLIAISATDALTGLANRRRFDEVLALEWNRAKRNGQPLALGLLDIDYFKGYNDRYGHPAGDACLVEVARLFQAHMQRSSDLAARYGGEEFAFIAPATDAAGALSIGRVICKKLEMLALPHVGSPLGVVTISIGIAVMVPLGDQEPVTLVTKADEALYQAKAQGRNCVVLSDISTPLPRGGLSWRQDRGRQGRMRS